MLIGPLNIIGTMNQFIIPGIGLLMGLIVTVLLTQAVPPAKATTTDFEPVIYQEKTNSGMMQRGGGSCS